MGTLNEDLTAIKAVEDKLTANKVANFAYTDYAYNNPLAEADGVETYDVNNEQNIPVANASVMKVNPTILTKGWRSQASSITRMTMNHFLGRCSYNLNKINDLMSSLLSTLMSHLGTANGLATLDANGYVPTTQLNLSKGDVGLGNVVNTGDSAVPTENGTDKFTTGGAYDLQTAVNGKAPINHASTGTDYGVASSANYGHVKFSGSVGVRVNPDTQSSYDISPNLVIYYYTTTTGFRYTKSYPFTLYATLITSRGCTTSATQATYRDAGVWTIEVSIPSDTLLIAFSADETGNIVV